MRVVDFVKDRKKTAAWLGDQSAKLEQLGHDFSGWSHNDGLGFGLVIAALGNSGELHLMSDGNVTYRVEAPDPKSGNPTVLESVSRKAVSVNDFEYIYNRFRDLILGVAPNNSFNPNPHQVR